MIMLIYWYYFIKFMQGFYC